ncbi:sensory box protein, light activated LOV domain-containing protein [Brucella vulpis]|nr:sensory box protein, light activated LOV domain-containing protein [Brucella vulpis]CUW51144.1 sensory box protein, light activated LOV domain-containing protein [Brucella vulpis]
MKNPSIFGSSQKRGVLIPICSRFESVTFRESEAILTLPEVCQQSGVINITWAIIEDKGEKKFHMRWAESRGPQVMQPARRGFGQRLLHSVLAEELKAKCDVEFAASGLLIDVLAPITPEVFPGMGHNAPEQRIA